MSNQQALDLEQLLQSGVAAARSGNRSAARALFLVLSREHPDDARVWVGLAGATSDRDEHLTALERALALDPDNQWARAALARATADERATPVLPETFAPPEAATTPEEAPEAAADAPTSEADTPLEPESARSPFPLLNLLALLLILLLLGALGVIIGRNLFGSGQPTVTTTPVLAVIPAPGAPPTPALGAPTAAPEQTQAAGPTGATAAAPVTGPTAAPPAPGASPQPSAVTAPTAQGPAPTSTTELPLGQVIEYDGWAATLLRPDYAVTLDGAIGDLQPAGRFALAVVAVTNNSPNPRLIPPDLFTMVDSAGRAYSPLPGASTAYLALYGRGQRGDLALEDVLDPGSGMLSVPLLFDIPVDATGLRLIMTGAAGAGWPVNGAAPSAPVGP